MRAVEDIPYAIATVIIMDRMHIILLVVVILRIRLMLRMNSKIHIKYHIQP